MSARLVLASGSPRRVAMLRELGYDIEVVPSGVDETVVPAESPGDCAFRLARTKANFGDHGAACVLAADTVVSIDGAILGKPNDEADFKRMMNALSNRTHEVWTGVFVKTPLSTEGIRVRTLVTFRRLYEDEINWYWRSGEPLDKAGGYAMQGLGGAFVASIEGSPSNVVGLPMGETVALLHRMGVKPPWQPE